VDRNKQPIAFLCYLTDGYLNLFRKIIPPFGGIDFSPIAACFALYIINIVLVRAIAMLGALIL
jgi:YggT family protein